MPDEWLTVYAALYMYMMYGISKSLRQRIDLMQMPDVEKTMLTALMVATMNIFGGMKGTNRMGCNKSSFPAKLQLSNGILSHPLLQKENTAAYHYRPVFLC